MKHDLGPAASPHKAPTKRCPAIKMRGNYIGKVYFLTTIDACHKDSVDCHDLSYVLQRANTTRAKIHDFCQPPSASCKPRYPVQHDCSTRVGHCSQGCIWAWTRSLSVVSGQLVGLFGSHSDSPPWAPPKSMNIIVIRLSKSNFQFSAVMRKVLI